MDEALAGALTAVELDASDAQRWFDMIIRVRQELKDSGSGDDWDAFKSALTAGAESEYLRSDLPVLFTEHLEYNGRLDVVKRMEEYGSNLPDLWAQAVAERNQPAEAPADVEPAASPWDTVVAQHGPGWAGWDGSEAGWTQFRDWFYTAANATDPAAYAEAYQRIDPLNALPLTDRIARLHEFGFTVNAVAQPEPAALDPWASAVTEHGAGWAGWDGSEAGWTQFRDWFYTAANATDPAAYAAAYERLEPLNTAGPADRIARLSELGLTINAVAPVAVPVPEAAEPEAAQAPVEPLPAPGTPEFATEVVAPIAAAVDARVPELAAQFGMSEEEVRAEIEALGPDFFAEAAAEELNTASS
jgi:hypothetical protein